MQLSLLSDTNIKKSIITVPIEQLKLSRFNPRRTREEEQVTRLAHRIARNGFEITRALWAYSENGHYEVFAGGTRLEAAKQAGVKKIPVILHEGLANEDVVRLAYEDNENDEYHEPVKIVEVWENYAVLYEEWGTEEKLAEVLGVSQQTVNYRLNYHKLPHKVKAFTTKGLLRESHLREIIKLPQCGNLEAWVTTETLQYEVAKQAADKKLKSEDIAALVAKAKEVIALAEKCHSKIPEMWQPTFIGKLARNQARTKAAVQTAYKDTIDEMEKVARELEEELARQQSEAEAARIQIQREQERNQKIQQVLECVVHGDFAQVAEGIEADSIDVIITDPPYPQEYLHLYELLAKEAARILKPGGSLITMCGQLYLPEVLNLMIPHLKYHWTLSYQTPGGQSPQIWPCKVNTFWKPVLWFTKGEYQGDWQGDVIKSEVNGNDKRFHKWGQSESGMAQLVQRFSQEGDLILDPFCGGGTTCAIAFALKRRFIGVDIKQQSVETTRERLIELLNEVTK